MPELWQDDGRCLLCGPQNRSGLALHFDADGEGAKAQGVVPPHLQGFAGKAHGGIVAAILDEAMFYAVVGQGMPLVATAELSVRYRQPLSTGRPFAVEARCTSVSRRLVRTEARLFCAGRIVATAQGTFLPVGRKEQTT